MDTGNPTRCKLQGVVIQDGFLFICECHMKSFCTCKSNNRFIFNLLRIRALNIHTSCYPFRFILFLHIIKPSNCVKLSSIQNLLHQRLLLQKRQHTLTACQSLVQIIGKAGQRHNRAKRSHHGNGTGKDSIKTNLPFSIEINRQRQHSERSKQDHQICK